MASLKLCFYCALIIIVFAGAKLISVSKFTNKYVVQNNVVLILFFLYIQRDFQMVDEMILLKLSPTCTVYE